MNKNAVNTKSQEFMDAMAALMRQALETPDGMRALAAAIAAPIEQEIARKEISSLLLSEETLPKGERAVYQKKPKVRAYWLSKDGEAREQEIGTEEVEIPSFRIHSTPMVDINVLKNGNIGRLTDLQTAAANAIRNEIDTRTLKVISASVPAENTVTVTGGVLTEDSLNEAIALLEDRELSVKTIVMRGGRFKDLKGWNLDPQTKNELRVKGVIKNYGTGGILITSSAEMNEVLVLPDEEIGKMPKPNPLQADALEEKTRFKVGWLVWQEIGHGVLRPDLTAKIRIVP